MGKYGYTFKGKYWILGAIGVVGFVIDYFMRVVRRLTSPWALL